MTYSWGNFFKKKQKIVKVTEQTVASTLSSLQQNQTYLPYGMGRSYGDSCLNSHGMLLETSSMRKFISFDEKTGVLHCESGVTLLDILKTFVPKGWFLPVTPGTSYVTVGGAIANDVHGKNHHTQGTFGHFVESMTLYRSDGEMMECSPTQHKDYFKATIGGLGLTGLIVDAKIKLQKIENAYIEQTTVKMKNVVHFLELSKESMSKGDDYIVSWVDCTSCCEGKVGQGYFITGNNIPQRDGASLRRPFAETAWLNIPIALPFSFINKWSIKAFNKSYLMKQTAEKQTKKVHFYPFFYPLDGILNWNKLYGSKGFVQYQCVFPLEGAEKTLHALFTAIAQSQQGSFLTVLKVMGEKKSLGLLSFARSGVTFAIDFPFKGKETTLLLEELDQIIIAAGGALYPAKDSRMSKEMFQQSFPQWEKMKAFKDPKISSDFWRRVTGEEN